MQWSRDQLRKSEGLHWLLDLTWGGRHYFHSEQHVTADAYGHGAEEWLDGLDVGGPLMDSVDPLSDSPAPRSVSITLTLPPGVDVPDLVARGFHLGSATARLLLWAEGTTEAITVIDGVVRDPQYETAGQPITFALEEMPFDDRALWPPVRAVVDDDTWPNADEKALGEMYPWIGGAPPLEEPDAFGSPGLVVSVTGSDPITGMTLLIAGHHCEGGTVAIRNVTDDTPGDTFTVEDGSDGDGNPVATVDLFEPGTTITRDDGGDAYWVRWGTSTHSGGMMVGGSLMRGAGDVLVWWLARSTIRWDRGRVAALVPRMNAYLLDWTATASADARFSPWDFVREHILPVLPISARMGGGGGGLYFVWYDWDASASDAVAHIDADGGLVERASAVSYSPRDDVANEWRLSYRIDSESDKYTARAVVTGSGETAALESSAVTSLLCERSNAMYGHRVKEITSAVICDAATAGRVAAWKANAHALQHRLVSYSLPRDMAWIKPGDVVKITDSDIGLSGAVALVDAMPWGPLEVFDVQLRILSRAQEWAV